MYPTYATPFTAIEPISVNGDAVSLACMVLVCMYSTLTLSWKSTLQPIATFIMPPLDKHAASLTSIMSNPNFRRSSLPRRWPPVLTPPLQLPNQMMRNSMSVPPSYHTGRSVHLPHIIRHLICLVSPRQLTSRISRIWTKTSSSNSFTFSRSTHHHPMSRHIKGNPLRHWSAWSTPILLHTCTTRIRPHQPFTPATLPTLDTKSTWTAEELHCITGCRRFCNYKHLIQSTKDGLFVDNGEIPASISAYATIPKAARGKPIDHTPSKYLNIVHINIAFGDCMSIGGYKYALIFVNRATQFNWCFGLKPLHHDDIIAGFMAFRVEAGSLACQFRCDCDEKSFGSHIQSFLHLECSLILATPAGRQSVNGLVESHWKIMVHMSLAYLTEKQMPHSFWYYTVKHSARMMNMIPGRYKDKLASPLMLSHGLHPDQRTLLPIFSLCYFHHEKNSNAQHSKNQAHTLDGIIIGRSPTSNAILVYNPQNQRYYKPDRYKINPYWLPSLAYPTIVYDGGLFVLLHRGDIPISISETYPPGTRIEEPSSSNDSIRRSGTVMDIPLDPTKSPQYLILFDNGSTKSVPAWDMPSFIPKPPA